MGLRAKIKLYTTKPQKMDTIYSKIRSVFFYFSLEIKNSPEHLTVVEKKSLMMQVIKVQLQEIFFKKNKEKKMYAFNQIELKSVSYRGS